MPFTTPEVAPTVAIPELLLVHEPPVVEVSVTDCPIQTLFGPVMTGVVFMVTVVVAEQPFV